MKKTMQAENLQTMRKIDTEELKKIQLKILREVADFCEKNNIKYWIDCGTLLGAIRHKGYIPWDDDIDVGMLREDYDKFQRIFNKEDGKYTFVSYESDPTFYLPSGKVIDNSTVLYEPDENGVKLAVNIDIFVYDNAPDDDKEVKKMFDERDRLRNAYMRTSEHINFEKNFLKRILRLGRKILYKIRYCGRAQYCKDAIANMIKNSKKYATCKTERVGDFMSFSRMVCSRRAFDSFVDVEFEGEKYKAPVGYDEWLRAFYGDYMQLPPVKERVSHHFFVAFYKD